MNFTLGQTKRIFIQNPEQKKEVEKTLAQDFV
jgi:hypothetical protein